MSLFKVEGMYRKGFCLMLQRYNAHCQHKWCFRYYKVTGPAIIDENPNDTLEEKFHEQRNKS